MIFWLAALLGVSTPAPTQIGKVAAAYYRAMPSISRAVGLSTVYDYYARLQNDERDPSESASLDVDLASQLISARYVPLASVRGLHEVLIRSSADGMLQAAAVFVPSTYVPGKPAPLVVFLHGHGESESQLVAPSFISAMAERSGSIIIAPYARGIFNFAGTAEQDVYDALDAASAAFTVDSRRTFLAGYSMGGFAV